MSIYMFFFFFLCSALAINCRAKKLWFWVNFAWIRRLYNKDQEVHRCFSSHSLKVLSWDTASGQTENKRIRVYVYFQFDHFPNSKIDFESRFVMRMSIFLF